MLKGVTRIDDAKRAVDAGVTAISVSNHGGNNLDGTPASIRLLPDIARAEWLICRVTAFQARKPREQILTQEFEQFIQRSSRSHSDVVDLVQSFGILSSRRQQISLHDVGDVTEVATGFSVTVYVNGIALQHGGGPSGNNCCIRAFGILSGPKYIEISEADGTESVTARKHRRVVLIHHLGGSVG